VAHVFFFLGNGFRWRNVRIDVYFLGGGFL